MEKETKNLMDKLKDFEGYLIKFRDVAKKDADFYAQHSVAGGEGYNLSERVLNNSKAVLKRFYTKFPGIKNYRKGVKE